MSYNTRLERVERTIYDPFLYMRLHPAENEEVKTAPITPKKMMKTAEC